MRVLRGVDYPEPTPILFFISLRKNLIQGIQWFPNFHPTFAPCPLHTHTYTHTQNTCSFFGQILVLDNFPVDGRGRCAPPLSVPPKRLISWNCLYSKSYAYNL